MRGLIRVLLCALAAGAAFAALALERNPVAHHPRALSAPSGAPERLVVRLRASPAGVAASARLATLATRAEFTLEGTRAITAQIHALRVRLAPGAALEETLARLRADPQVEYAELDQRRYAHGVVPSDPLYAQQWFLMPSSATTPSAIDAQSAWSTTTGSAALVIADVDTGVRFEHPDLRAAASGGRLLPGYCFISDALIANNSTCPGPDASDPGDWVTSADLSQSECSGSEAAVSSWHGTRVAGILGALSNNGVGIAGITWGAQILPLRALGKCGGFDSDIIKAMLWAAGIPVSGAAGNPTPAKIINLSLGGAGACTASLQDAVNQVSALGVLVVASAGNEGGPVDAPANCVGVVAVAGLRHAGTKVGYSSLGPQIALGAPAGNCVNTGPGQPCIYTLTSTTNLGAQVPDASDYTGEYYCDSSTGSTANCQITAGQYRTYNLGTSFSAPLVAGIAALMASSNAKLNACQLAARLKEGALPYPQTSVGESPQPPMCHVPSSATDIQGSECVCTGDGQTCGAGMANAAGALAAALRPIAAITLPASAASGQTVQLQGTGSAAIPGHSLTAFSWSNSAGAALALQNANGATASLVMPACGISGVRLTVTDDAGRSDTADVVVTPDAITSDAPPSAGDVSCSFTPPAVELAVCPASASVQAGSGTQTLTASVVNTDDASVTWEVEGIPGGNANLGTVSSGGVYTPPAQLPDNGATVTVTAVSVADPNVSASSTLTITAPVGGGGGGGGALECLTLLAGLVALGVRRRAGARRA
ncbi:MAG TPA: S8 family serine peptidase [Steroidobacteraceae bacterium]|nr:S8 family serine peptidase [Steroidobacteraceae bacterium]